MKLETMEKTALGLKQGTLTKLFLAVVTFVSLFAVSFSLIQLSLKKQAVKAPDGDGPVVATASQLRENKQKQAIDKIEQERLQRLIEADSIILAEVEKTQYEIVSLGESNNFPITNYSLKVIKLLKGSHSQNKMITVRHYGGVLDGARSQGVEDMPILKEGGIYLLFLRDQYLQTEVQVSPFIDYAEGVFPVVNDKGMPIIVGHDGQRVTFEDGTLHNTSEIIPLTTSLNNLVSTLQSSEIEEIMLSVQSLPSQENFEGVEQYICEYPWIDQTTVVYPNCTF
ncbi:hypothetical protein KKI23_04250, partial [Patescibacteria group bacterium]|nr:hypothetical protein [Patescibacteria group bacterium]